MLRYRRDGYKSVIEKVFQIGSYQQSPFGLLVVLAFVAGFFQLRANMRRLRLGDEDDAHVLVFWAMMGGVVGGKVYYAILNWDWRLLLERYGFVWYGGFMLGTTAVLLALRRRRLSVARIADAGAPAMALGYAVGRIGCFLVGDDYGVPTSLPWGVKFPVGLPPSEAGALRSVFGVAVPAEIPAGELLAVHPTQLYETALALGIWGLGLWALSRFRRPGSVGLLVLALLAVERFAVEFLRAKDDRFFDPFTVAQVISVALLVVLAVLSSRLPPARAEESSA